MTTAEQVHELIHRAWTTSDGPAQIAIAEQAMTHAEALADPDLEYRARAVATRAYHQGGEPMKAMMTFARNLAEYDAHPGSRTHQDEHQLLWQFKYMISSMTKFPEVPLDRTNAVLDDMESRYRAGGHSLHAVYAYRHTLALHLGDTILADHWYRYWDTAPRDSNSDCVGCDPTSKADHHAWRGADEEAIAVAESAISGRLTCSEQPHAILTSLMLPYLRTGRLEEARNAHRRAYRAYSDNVANLAQIGTHIEFCALTGNDLRALELIERHLSWLDRAPTPKAEMEFAAAAANVLHRLHAGGHPNLQVRRAAGPIAADELAHSLTTRARAIAERFDARNGNTHQSGRIAAKLAMSPIVDYLPLSVTAAHRLRPAAPAATVEPDLSDVPESLALDEQFDRLEDLFDQEDERRAEALGDRILSRFANAELTALQRGRLLRVKCYRLGTKDLDAQVPLLDEAIRAFHEAGDRERELSSRAMRAIALVHSTGDPSHASVGIEASLEGADIGKDSKAKYSTYSRAAYLEALSGHNDEALALLKQAEEHSSGIRPRSRVRLAVLKSGLLAAQGDLGAAIAEIRSAIEVLRPLGRSDELGGLFATLAQMLSEQGDNAGTIAAFEEAAATSVDPEQQRSNRANAGFMLVTTPRAAEFVNDIVEHVCIMAAEGLSRAANYTRHRLALALWTTERFRECAEVAEEALGWFLEQDSVEDRSMVLPLREILARTYEQLGERHVAAAQLDLIAELLTDAEDLPHRGEVHERAAELLWQADRDSDAAARFEKATQDFEQAGLALATIHSRRRLVMALHQSGQADEADAALHQLSTLMDRAEVPEAERKALTWERATAGYEAAMILVNRDRPDHATALARIAPVADLYRSLPAPEEAALAELRHGTILVLSGRPADGESVLRRVLDELPKDHGALKDAAHWLARALEERGEERQARKVRKKYGLN